MAFHVLGIYKAERTVGHAALLASDATLTPSGPPSKVFESCPPLMLGPVDGLADSDFGDMSPALVGWVSDLTQTERHGMESWIEFVKTQRPVSAAISEQERIRHEYTVLATDDVPDPVSNTVTHTRYSCAGFVYYCYFHGAAMELVDLESVPMMSADKISLLFSISLQAIERRGQRFGLQGEGPWPILAPGYIFHALSRSDAEVRTAYVPESVDWQYPRKESEITEKET